MPTYYVWSGGSNTAPYDTMAKAATDPNTIEAIPVAAGDILRMRGTFNGTWTWAVSGTSTTNTITCIGVDATDTAYGAQYTIDRTSSGNYCVDGVNHTYRIMHNVTGINPNTDSFYRIGNYSHVQQCIADAAGRHGFNVPTRSTYINCIARNCTSNGFSGVSQGYMFACYAFNNTGVGFSLSSGGQVVHCGAWDNDVDNFQILNGRSLLASCFAHSSSAGSGLNITAVANWSGIFANAFTNNNQYGIECAAGNSTTHEDYNGFFNNGVGARLNVPVGRNSQNFTALPYINAGGGNFSTADLAEFRRTEIDMEFA